MTKQKARNASQLYEDIKLFETLESYQQAYNPKIIITFGDEVFHEMPEKYHLVFFQNVRGHPRKF